MENVRSIKSLSDISKGVGDFNLEFSKSSTGDTPTKSNNESTDIVMNSTEYQHHNLIFNVNENDTLITVNWNAMMLDVKNINSNKLYFLIIICFGAIGGMISDVTFDMVSYSTHKEANQNIWICVSIISIIGSFFQSYFSLSWILTTNVHLVKLCRQTFDFYFKTYNMLLILIALGFFSCHNNNNDRSWLVGIFTTITFIKYILTFSSMFLIDALVIPQNTKIIMLTIALLYALSKCLVFYFCCPELYFNAFSNTIFYTENATVNFRNVRLSSWFNLFIFFGKGLLKYFYQSVKRKKAINTKNSNIKSGYNYPITTTLYQKPWIKWKNSNQIRKHNSSDLHTECNKSSTNTDTDTETETQRADENSIINIFVNQMQYKRRVVINIDKFDNKIDEIIHQHNNKLTKMIEFYFYKIALNMWFGIIMIGCGFLAESLGAYTHDDDIGFVPFWVLEIIFKVPYTISIILSANRYILKLTLKSFDFWFLSFNFLQALAIYVYWIVLLNSGFAQVDHIRFVGFIITDLLTYFMFFSIDALLVSQNVKMIISVIAALSSTYKVYQYYFLVPKGNFVNIFDNTVLATKHSNIDLVYMIMNCWINLSVYLWKPLIFRLYFTICCRNNCKCNKNIMKTDLDMIRMTAIYQRPYLNITNSDTNNKHKLNNEKEMAVIVN